MTELTQQPSEEECLKKYQEAASGSGLKIEAENIEGNGCRFFINGEGPFLLTRDGYDENNGGYCYEIQYNKILLNSNTDFRNSLIGRIGISKKNEIQFYIWYYPEANNLKLKESGKLYTTDYDALNNIRYYSNKHDRAEKKVDKHFEKYGVHKIIPNRVGLVLQYDCHVEGSIYRYWSLEKQNILDFSIKLVNRKTVVSATWVANSDNESKEKDKIERNKFEKQATEKMKEKRKVLRKIKSGKVKKIILCILIPCILATGGLYSYKLFKDAEQNIQKKVIVIQPINYSEVTSKLDAQILVAKVIQYISNKNNLTVVDRTKMDAIEKEQEFNMSEWSEKNKSVEIGIAKNADIVLTIIPMTEYECTLQFLQINTMETKTYQIDIDSIWKYDEKLKKQLSKIKF